MRVNATISFLMAASCALLGVVSDTASADRIHHRELQGWDDDSVPMDQSVAGVRNRSSTSSGAYAEAHWHNAGCSETSYVEVSVSKSISSYMTNGFLNGTRDNHNAYIYLMFWSDCAATTATRTRMNLDSPYANANNLVVDANLDSASYIQRFEKISFDTQSCDYHCVSRGRSYNGSYNADDDASTDDDIGSRYCLYGNCTVLSNRTGTVDVKVTWTATDRAASTYKDTNERIDPEHTRYSVNSGLNRPATAVISILFDGAAIDIPKNVSFTGSTRTSNSFSVYATW